MENKEKYMKKYSSFQNMGFVLKKTIKYQPILLPFLLLFAFTQASQSFIWVVIPKVIIDAIELNRSVMGLLIIVSIAILIQLVLWSISAFISSQSWWRFINARMHFILERIKKSNTMHYAHLENPDVLDLCQRAANSTGGNSHGIEGMMNEFNSLLVHVVETMAAASILFVLNPLLVLILFVFSIIDYLIYDFIKKIEKKQTYDKLAPYDRKINYVNYITKNFDFAKDIRLYHMKNFINRKQREIHKDMHQIIVKSKNRWIYCELSMQVFRIMKEAIVYIWLIIAYLNNQITIANLTLYFGSIRTFYVAVGLVLTRLSNIRSCSREVNDYRSFMEYDDGTKDHYLELPNYEHYEFTFENVSFKYPGQDNYALKNLNLTLKAGERLAVVGFNGAGKTTFIKLLSRLYEPTEGTIYLNGIDIKKYRREDYYFLFSPVFQNIECFALPLAENVSMASPTKTDKTKVLRALQLAGLDDKINSLANGIDTQMLKFLYDDGIDLSGGERQKLALARALYKDAPVVILDEPTSALDALAEYHMYVHFDQLVKKKTAVYISHRLSSTRFCDRIVMFKDGELIEEGTHEALMKQDSEYKKMFEVQAQYYQDEVKCCGF